MSCKIKGRKLFNADTGYSSVEGQSVSKISLSQFHQLSHGVSDIGLSSAQGDAYEVYSRNSENRAGSSSAISSAPQISATNAWGNPDDKFDMDDDDSYSVDDSDDDFLSDDFDSDSSKNSHEICKKNKWLKAFFEKLDKMTAEEINDPSNWWNCPACKGGRGETKRYHGLDPLLMHAKTQKSRRMKLHQQLAELLDEKLRRRGAAVLQNGESLGQWQGLDQTHKDYMIVWPPMVIVMNTRHEKDRNEKWTGMGNPELLDYFSKYAPMKARHSYGPPGHRGMSVLIFEGSVVGYFYSKYLHKHFKYQKAGRDAWNHGRVLFCPSGKRQLYCFLATKDDLDFFNQHSKDNSKLKFEMRSYQEVVVKQMKQMSVNNQQLVWYKDKLPEEQKTSKVLAETIAKMGDKERRLREEICTIRERTKSLLQQKEEELGCQEEFFKEQMEMFHQPKNANRDGFEKLLKEDEDHMNAMKQRHLEEKMEVEEKHSEEEVKLQKKLNAELTRIIEKDFLKHPAEDTSIDL